MTGRDESWLAANLREAAPEPPRTSDLLAGVAVERRAARRRRTAVALVASAAAVVAIAVTVPALERSGRERTQAPGAPADNATTPQQPADNRTPCLDPADYDMTQPMERTPVPKGPIRARLCAVDDADDGDQSVLGAPADPLTYNLDELVAVIDRRSSEPIPQSCAGTGGMSFAIELGYADGSTHTVPANTGSGCGSGRPLFDTFTRLLGTQRQSQTPPYRDAKAACPSPVTFDASSMMGDFNDAVSMIACVTDHAVTTWSQEVPVPAKDREVLIKDAAAEVRPGPDGFKCADHKTSILLRGVTAWGDSVSQWAYSCRSFYNAWTPSDDGMAVLDRLIGPTTAR
jgi:hypothetical protein